MITFKEFLAESQMNEVKISNTQALKYFKLIQKALGSRTMDVEDVKGTLEVKYDTVSLFFKEGYLVGFRDEDGETYEVSRSLKSVKDLKSVKEIQKHFGAPKAPERMQKPAQQVYNYFPENGVELKKLVDYLIKERGDDADLNDIDTSKVVNFVYLFAGSRNFNGDISKWDVSNAEDMSNMFQHTKFNGDISKWDVSNVEDMTFMFGHSKFNGNISKWNVSKVTHMGSMFKGSSFNSDISKWNVSNVKNMYEMFKGSPLEGKEPHWYRD